MMQHHIMTTTKKVNNNNNRMTLTRREQEQSLHGNDVVHIHFVQLQRVSKVDKSACHVAETDVVRHFR